MKRILLSVIALAAFAFESNSQIVTRVVSPASVAGNLDFEWAPPPNWGTPDFNVPNTFVQDTLAFVADSTPGLNAQGNPLSEEGCGALTNGQDVIGKIAMIYRGTCEFGTKALNAQNAGAVGVIIINRDEEAVGMGAGADGASVTIPVVMIWASAGANLKAEMQNGPVVAFLGNKTGSNANDIATSAGECFAPKGGMTDFFTEEITPRIQLTNIGIEDQDSVYVSVTINNGVSDVYDESFGPLAVDSGAILSIEPAAPQAFSSWPVTGLGSYTMTYSISMANVADDDESDNTVVYNFSVSSGSVAASRTNANNEPIATQGNLLGGAFPGLSECISFSAADASKAAVTGVKFIPYTDTDLYDLNGAEVQFALYEWDPSTDGASQWNLPNVLEVARASDFLTSNAQSLTVVELNLDNKYPLEDDKTYLGCLETFNTIEVGFGYDNTIDLDGNNAWVGRPAAPVFADQWYGSTFGTGSAVAVQVSKNDVGVNENELLSASVFPNPANNEVNLRLNAEGAATVLVSDISGKIVINKSINLVNGKTTIDTDSLEPGMYIFNVTMANGQSTKVNVVKK